MGYNVIYIIHCSVFTQSMVVKEFVIFEISLKKNVFRLGTGNRQMEKVKWILVQYIYLRYIFKEKSLNL